MKQDNFLAEIVQHQEGLKYRVRRFSTSGYNRIIITSLPVQEGDQELISSFSPIKEKKVSKSKKKVLKQKMYMPSIDELEKVQYYIDKGKINSNMRRKLNAGYYVEVLKELDNAELLVEEVLDSESIKALDWLTDGDDEEDHNLSDLDDSIEIISEDEEDEEPFDIFETMIDDINEITNELEEEELEETGYDEDLDIELIDGEKAIKTSHVTNHRIKATISMEPDTEDIYSLAPQQDNPINNQGLEIDETRVVNFINNLDEKSVHKNKNITLAEAVVKQKVGGKYVVHSEYIDNEPTYEGEKLIYDKLQQYSKEGLPLITTHEHGDRVLAHQLVEIIDSLMLTSKPLGTVAEEGYLLDNNRVPTEFKTLKYINGLGDNVTEIMNIGYITVGKQSKNKRRTLDLLYKEITFFKDRYKLIDGTTYVKEIEPQPDIAKKYLGSEHKIINFPGIEYFNNIYDLSHVEKADYRIVRTREEMLEVRREIDALHPDHVIAYDAETTGLKFGRRIPKEMASYLVSHSLSWKDNQAVIIPLHMEHCGNATEEDFNEIIKPILETRRILCHNGAADVRFNMPKAIYLNLEEDTFVLIKHIIPYIAKQKKFSKLRMGLGSLVKRAFGIDFIDLNKHVFTPAGVDFDFSKLPEEYLIYYGCPDTDWLRQLWMLLRPKLDSKQEMAYRTMVKFSSVVARRSDYNGIRVSKTDIIDEIENMQNSVDLLEQTALHLAGETADTLNIGSNKQLANFIYGKMGVPINERTKRTDSGDLATDNDVLKDLAAIKRRTPSTLFKEDIIGFSISAQTGEREVLLKAKELNELKYPFCAILLEYKKLNKELTTYFIGLVEKSIDGIYYTDYRIGRTDTWRTTEGLQTTKGVIKSGLGVYDDEWYYLSMDFAAEELRLAVLRSEDKLFKEILADPESDSHTSTAATIFNKPLHLVTPDDRGRAKGCNFGIIYGMKAATLAKQIFKTDYPTDEQIEITRKIYESYVYTFSEMISSLQESVDEVTRDGWLYNDLHFKMVYDDVVDTEDFEEQVFDPNRNEPPVVKLSAERYNEFLGRLKNKAGNYPIQSLAAGLLMMLVNALDKRLKEEGIPEDKVAIPLLVHDEVGLMVHQSIPPLLMLKIMIDIFELRLNYTGHETVPLYLGLGFGHSWGFASGDTAELPVKLQHELYEEYESGNYRKDIPATEVKDYFLMRKREYIRRRLKELFPSFLETGIYDTGHVIDTMRLNPFELSQGNALFKFFDGRTDSYKHEKLASALIKGTEWKYEQIRFLDTEPTPTREIDPETDVVEFFHNIVVHPRLLILGDTFTVDLSTLTKDVAKNLLRYILQFVDTDDHPKAKTLVMDTGSSKEVTEYKILGLPLNAKDRINDILKGSEGETLAKRNVEINNVDISATDILYVRENKVVLDLVQIPMNSREKIAEKFLSALKPFLSPIDADKGLQGFELIVRIGEDSYKRVNYQIKGIPNEILEVFNNLLYSA